MARITHSYITSKYKHKCSMTLFIKCEEYQAVWINLPVLTIQHGVTENTINVLCANFSIRFCKDFLNLDLKYYFNNIVPNVHITYNQQVHSLLCIGFFAFDIVILPSVFSLQQHAKIFHL